MTAIHPHPGTQNAPLISDAVLNQILNAMSLCGEHPIAKLALILSSLRSFRQELAAFDLTLYQASEAYDEALCSSLSRALQQVHAIDNAERMNLRVLQDLWKEQQSPLPTTAAQSGAG
jgi:hypothetical protein